MKNPVKQTKVVYKETHDKLALTTTFPSGGSLKFSVSRGGEKLMVGFSNDPVICKQQLACVAKWVKLSDSESNGQRMLRIKSMCESCNSGSEMIEKIKQEKTVV
jgi:hypothetical protein